MTSANKSERLEKAMRTHTQPLHEQYPRPWMTDLTNPADADVFIVGKNQKNAFDEREVGDHDHYIDSLFNRGPESCRQLYDRLVERPSRTRRVTDDFVSQLQAVGVSNVLQTNVICYSTAMSDDLRQAVHAGGEKRGREIFAALFHIIGPRVVIAHGVDTTKVLSRFLGIDLPSPPKEPCKPLPITVGQTSVFVISSLAGSGYTMWSKWSKDHLSKVSAAVATILREQL